ncbi:MAG TPA: prepilin-type N-terminal cleavage/methylation domain-containing protein [Motilibacterales bacterium]|nr:prepilin-type N-terminal cleavage/methylation domain-containing protein [Motilibacterales bacterium]
MINRLQAARTEETGFSLIELLIVIVVLGVLGGIVVFGVGAFKGDSEAAACAANLKTVQVAATAYQAKTGDPAADLAALQGAGYIESIPDNIVVKAGVVTDNCPVPAP